MAKSKKCDGECEAYKKLTVEVHEPEDWGTEEDIGEWQTNFIDELIEENEILEIKLEKKERNLETAYGVIWAVIVWNLILTALCAIL